MRRRLTRVLAAAAVLTLPLLPAAPANAYEYGCWGTYPAEGSASATCIFAYLGGSVTISSTASGDALGLKFVAMGLYTNDGSTQPHVTCQDEVSYGYSASCSATVTPNVSIGTLLKCSSGAAVRPIGTVTYSCR